MNKADLIEALQKETGLTKAGATQVVDLFFDLRQILGRDGSQGVDDH